MKRVAVAILMGTALLCSVGASAEEAPDLDTRVAEMEKKEGLLTFYLDRAQGKVWLEVPAGEDGLVGEYIYVEGLVTGLGSNPIGLDRGQLGDSRLVKLRRVANRLLIEQPNLGYRALTDDPAEAAATRQSFATSVLWSGELESTTWDGRSLVDFTSFLVRDAHGVSDRLTAGEQGNFTLDASRSVVDPDACLAFPNNVEFEAVLTYAGSGEIGQHVQSTAPTPEAVTLVQHHSFVRLPDDGYRPREFDPRAGSFAIGFQDYAAPLGDSIHRSWIVRHRLKEGDSLVYYVDRAAPEPVRSALVDGAKWWAEAFAAAGFPGAFQVELLPEGAHPLDVRYNVIQWVHRSTRGWSYGGGVIDPRTGEMVKGHVSLGSLRVRQDRLIFEGLLGADVTGSGGANDPIEVALARIRQLSAHEVGHTLGITHNFAASTYGRESVMDYPAPLVKIDGSGNLDLSDAYDVGIGDWDIHAIQFAYTELDGDEKSGLEEILRQGREHGLIFITDHDARPPGAAQPVGSLWDNGADAVTHFEHEMRVRRIALDRFGPDRVAVGSPLALLEEVLATVYFRHRYQLEAAIKVVGGMDYAYVVRGDGQPAWSPLAGQAQRRGLDAVLDTLSAAELDIPDKALAALHPRPFGYDGNRELFTHGTSPSFDALGAAATAADLVVAGLLQHERAARMVDFHGRDSSLPGFDVVLSELVAAAFDPDPTTNDRQIEIQRVVQSVVVARLVELAGNPGATVGVRARAEATLEDLHARLDSATEAGQRYLARQIARQLERLAAPAEAGPAAPPIPPGSPIGSGTVPSAPEFCSFDGEAE
jgi:hypothetical protein